MSHDQQPRGGSQCVVCVECVQCERSVCIVCVVSVYSLCTVAEFETVPYSLTHYSLHTVYVIVYVCVVRVDRVRSS